MQVMVLREKKVMLILVPTDTDSQTIQFTGYQLSTLYSNLGELPAKSVTVILRSVFLRW